MSWGDNDIMQADAPDKYNFQNGWMSPDGLWYSCESFDHYNAAYSIVLDILRLDDVYAVTDYLEGRGWLHIASMYALTDAREATQAQINVLYEMLPCAEERGLRDEFIENVRFLVKDFAGDVDLG